MVITVTLLSCTHTPTHTAHACVTYTVPNIDPQGTRIGKVDCPVSKIMDGESGKEIKLPVRYVWGDICKIS